MEKICRLWLNTVVQLHRNRIANLMKYGSGADSCEIPDYVTEEDVVFLEHAAGVELTEMDAFRADRLCAMQPAAPWNIIAITFTNKAANELKDRLSVLQVLRHRISGP